MLLLKKNKQVKTCCKRFHRVPIIFTIDQVLQALQLFLYLTFAEGSNV